MNSPDDADSEYIYVMGSEMRCKLLAKLNIPSAWVK